MQRLHRVAVEVELVDVDAAVVNGHRDVEVQLSDLDVLHRTRDDGIGDVAVYRRSGAREGESVTIDVDGGTGSELLAVVPGREVVIVQLGLNGALRNDASPSHRT